jgi:hypothetical protein
MGDWLYRWSKDNAFPILYWVGTWSIFDWIQRFHGWLDNTLPWRLRARLKSMWEENKSLCTQLQTVQWEVIQTKAVLKEALEKMHMPIGGNLPRPSVKAFHYDDLETHEQVMPIHKSTFRLTFPPYQVTVCHDPYSFPRYSRDLMVYMSDETADRMIVSIKEYVAKEVFKYYENEFLEQ